MNHLSTDHFLQPSSCMTTASLKPEGPFAEVRNGMATGHR